MAPANCVAPEHPSMPGNCTTKGLVLTLQDKRTIALSPGERVSLGRAHVRPSRAALRTSRTQCVVQAAGSADSGPELGIGRLEVEKTALNVTRILRGARNGPADAVASIEVVPGHCEAIFDGDLIALIPGDDSEVIEVHGADDGLPMSKRARAGAPAHPVDDVDWLPRGARPTGGGLAPTRSQVVNAAPAGTGRGPSTSTERVMLVLIGAPGAGKSTFAQQLQSSGAARWRRVNQDTVARGGTRGTRKQCLQAARRALTSGHSVTIDRCNFDDQQRGDFLDLARSLGVRAWALYFNLPLKDCVRRASSRVGHEGGVEGFGAASVVSRMHSQLRAPTVHEGFQGITVCRSDADIDAALRHCQQWDASGAFTIPSLGAPGPLASLWSRSAQASPSIPASQSPSSLWPLSGHTMPPSGHTMPPSGHTAPLLGHIAPPLGHIAPPSGHGLTPWSPAGMVGISAIGPGAAFQALLGGLLSTGVPVPSAAHVAAVPDVAMPGPSPSTAQGSQESAKDAFAVLMGSARAAAASPGARKAGPGAGGGATGPGGCGQRGSAGRGGGDAMPVSRASVGNSPRDALRRYAADPERFRPDGGFLRVTDAWVMLEDKYPKARRHALVVARDLALGDLGDLGREHVGLIRDMERAGLDWAQAQTLASPAEVPRGFQLGFHAIPSMPQLHMHVVSQEFDSACLKTKRHYNTFTTRCGYAASVCGIWHRAGSRVTCSAPMWSVPTCCAAGTEPRGSWRLYASMQQHIKTHPRAIMSHACSQVLRACGGGAGEAGAGRARAVDSGGAGGIRAHGEAADDVPRVRHGHPQHPGPEEPPPLAFLVLLVQFIGSIYSMTDLARLITLPALLCRAASFAAHLTSLVSCCLPRGVNCPTVKRAYITGEDIWLDKRGGQRPGPGRI